jgi:hypothetical protein
MNESKQGSQSIETFAEKLSRLGDRLAAIEMREAGAVPANEAAIKKIFEQQVVSAFKKGINSNLQAAVCAARPQTLQDAIQVASEIEAVTPPVVTVNVVKEEVKKCTICNKTGHLSDKCWHKRDPQDKKINYQRSNHNNRNFSSNNNRGRGSNNYNTRGRGNNRGYYNGNNCNARGRGGYSNNNNNNYGQPWANNNRVRFITMDNANNPTQYPMQNISQPGPSYSNQPAPTQQNWNAGMGFQGSHQ